MADSDDESFGDWEEDVGSDALDVKSIFSDKRFATIKELIDFDKANFSGFDLAEVVRQLGSDDLHIITLVNFLRREVLNSLGSPLLPESPEFVGQLLEKITKKDFLKDEGNMVPTLADDALLFELKGFVYPDDDDSSSDVDEQSTNVSAVSTSTSSRGEGNALSMPEGIAATENKIAKIAAMQAQIEQMQSLIKNLTIDEEGDINNEIDSDYFGSYSGSDIHETMLSDTHRTISYQNAILKNAAFFKGKVVLDVGCGTGILSMFAAKAGAKKVIAVDNSDMLNFAKKIILRNGLESQIVCVKGKIEDNVVDDILSSDEKVDIVVSEWMGYGLYFENMLPSVIYARDRYTTKEGVMMPSHSQIFLEALTASGKADRVSWWKDVYGFDMTDMQGSVLEHAQVEVFEPEFVISDRSLVHELDLNVAVDEDLDFSVPFALNISRSEQLRCLAITFDVIFKDSRFDCTEVLTTSIQTEYTHWKHTVLYFSPENVRSVNPGDRVFGTLHYNRPEMENSRGYNIKIDWRVESTSASAAESCDTFSQEFRLN